jgi:hypothetical protein
MYLKIKFSQSEWPIIQIRFSFYLIYIYYKVFNISNISQTILCRGCGAFLFFFALPFDRAMSQSTLDVYTETS